MNLSVITPDGCEHRLQALVDTGAQKNCIILTSVLLLAKRKYP
jgi:hypothetical protein